MDHKVLVILGIALAAWCLILAAEIFVISVKRALKRKHRQRLSQLRESAMLFYEPRSL